MITPPQSTKAVPVGRRRIWLSALVAGSIALALAACTSPPSPSGGSVQPPSPSGGSVQSMAPIVFAPGLGMSALNVTVDTTDATTSFTFLVPAMNPVEVLPDGASSALDYSVASGLPRSAADQVPRWLSLVIDGRGAAENQPGVSVTPVSVGEDFSAECPRYLALADQLEQAGWTVDADVYCLPFDYRYAPGDNSFVKDFTDLVERAVAQADGTKAVIACHSQGCLMAYHALRVVDPAWVESHIAFLYGFAGQFSGCSDCLRWAFQEGWSWDTDNENASPVDPTWVGEMGLGLQSSVYGDAVLFTNGDREYRAADAADLLDDAGAVAMGRATARYSLDDQDWFRQGSVAHEQLPIPSRFVFGIDLPTTVGYAFDDVDERTGTCDEPECTGFWNSTSPAPIEADGDGGDSSWMNRAPEAWTPDPSCDIRTLPGVNHMDIVTNAEAVSGLIVAARASVGGVVPCAPTTGQAR